jgi:hypothetical protein
MESWSPASMVDIIKPPTLNLWSHKPPALSNVAICLYLRSSRSAFTCLRSSFPVCLYQRSLFTTALHLRRLHERRHFTSALQLRRLHERLHFTSAHTLQPHFTLYLSILYVSTSALSWLVGWLLHMCWRLPASLLHHAHHLDLSLSASSQSTFSYLALLR